MVWKKPENDPPQPEPASAQPRPSYTTPTPAAAPSAASAASATSAASAASRERATIGPSIFIKGDLAGEEDLIVEGRVEGRVDLRQHSLTVGKNGRVKADVIGRIVMVEGEVDGNVFAEEQAVVRKSGTVRGNITSPRVTLEDGSRFKGSIDMEAKEPPRAAAGSASAGASSAAAGATAASAQPSRRESPVEPAAPRAVQEPVAAGGSAGATA